MFTNATSYIHAILSLHLKQGDIAIDATAGNGWDTEHMARLVGGSGKVYGFDVQQIALDVTTARLTQAGLSADLFLAGHETMKVHVPPEHHKRVAAVTFNLGYLPGGNKDVTTLASTTAIALQQAQELLAPGGVIAIACYQHAEGKKEIEGIRAALQQFVQEEYTCTETIFINQRGTPPVVFIVT